MHQKAARCCDVYLNVRLRSGGRESCSTRQLSGGACGRQSRTGGRLRGLPQLLCGAPIGHLRCSRSSDCLCSIAALTHQPFSTLQRRLEGNELGAVLHSQRHQKHPDNLGPNIWESKSRRTNCIHDHLSLTHTVRFSQCIRSSPASRASASWHGSQSPEIAFYCDNDQGMSRASLKTAFTRKKETKNLE